MASIMGFQMKNIKRTLGREGYGCVASVYLNGKKIGTYEDYGDGALGDINYISKEAEEAMMNVIVAYAKEHPNNYIVNLYKERPEQFKEECKRFKKRHPYISDEDITLETMASNSIMYIAEDFLNLWNLEKSFKKYQKKGYRAIGVKENELTAYPADWSDEKILKEATGETIYATLEDFVK